MFKSITTNAIVAVSIAALAATLTTFVGTGAVPEAKAHAQDLVLPVTVPAPAMADRLPAIEQGNKGNACSSRGWPHYEQSCLFDFRTSANEAGTVGRTVRLIVLR